MSLPAPDELIARVLEQTRLLAVVTLADAALAVPLVRALAAGGVTAVEITLRTPAALDAIRLAAADRAGVAVGAGTCLTAADLQAAQAAGAAFAVSPGLSPELLDAAAAMALPYLPGVATPTEVMTALSRGYRTLKLFPVASLGGADYLRALAGPFPGVRFSPSGGVTLDTAPQLLALTNVACVGASWLAPGEALRASDWPRIEALARQTMARIANPLS